MPGQIPLSTSQVLPSVAPPELPPDVIATLQRLNFKTPQEVQALSTLVNEQQNGWNIPPLPNSQPQQPSQRPIVPTPEYRQASNNDVTQAVDAARFGDTGAAQTGKFQISGGQLYFIPDKPPISQPRQSAANGLVSGKRVYQTNTRETNNSIDPQALARYNSRDDALNLAAQNLINNGRQY